ncbi:hypothetical protein ESCO_001661 [Escovopsis weberi]|uniref:Aminoglycoside phosphotransferase domain-containing protein n=1 Tax=Escovopsis weberi TaxID=150374 RepID=A0A0M8N3K0_ESCWE|nr:hypothetical protein ESCO_001661 [Escovopsis weberi]
MRVYLLERIPGVPYSEFRARPEFADNAREFRERLLGDLAWALALSFQSRKSPDSILLLDGTDADTGAGASRLARGRVGSSLRARLELLEALPAHAQRHVSEVARRLDAVEGSPWCLTHGDLVAGNVMVDPATGHLTGLVDWAEAEWLPFGVALYGVEEVLGGAGEGPGFAYCAGHEELRRHFWDRLLALSRCGDLGIRPWLGEVEAARKLGVLLWVGIAFDEGRIDRVIEPGRDEAEMQKLTPFLEAACPVDAAGDGDRERGRRGSRVGIWLRELGVAFGQLCR